MSGATLDEQVAMVIDAYEAGIVDRAGAMDALIEATGMSPDLCARMLAAEVMDRRRKTDHRAPADEQGPRNDDGTWTP
ncbi:MAG TPA: hypothetical protein VIS29_14790 [Streptomyces sp.]